MRMLIFTLYLFVATLMLSAQTTRENTDSLKVLFVGNSYTYVQNIPQVVSIISDSTKTKLITQKSTIGGARLSEHWRGERGLKTKELIKTGHFDIVVLQDQSMSTLEVPDSVLKYIHLFCNYIRANGAVPYLYETWAREKVPQFQEEINSIYIKAAKENNAILVPVGQAFDLTRKLRPDLELFLPDGSHQSQLGAYLSACVFVATITKELPKNIPNYITSIDMFGESIILIDYIDRLDVEFFRRVALEVLNLK